MTDELDYRIGKIEYRRHSRRSLQQKNVDHGGLRPQADFERVVPGQRVLVIDNQIDLSF